jgi:hypothetical protein
MISSFFSSLWLLSLDRGEPTYSKNDRLATCQISCKNLDLHNDEIRTGFNNKGFTHLYQHRFSLCQNMME